MHAGTEPVANQRRLGSAAILQKARPFRKNRCWKHELTVAFDADSGSSIEVFYKANATSFQNPSRSAACAYNGLVITWPEFVKLALIERGYDIGTPRSLDFEPMPFEYVNRRGERYYLLQGKTRTGKPKDYVSRKPAGVPVEQVPEGYEFYENPERGRVSVRKVRTSRITPAERDLLTRWTRQFAGIEYFCVDVQADSLVVYTPSTDPVDAVSALSEIFGAFPGREAAAREWMGKQAIYLPMRRFTLVDEEKPQNAPRSSRVCSP
jgi:hypothetical protein